jgi:thymidylate synthase (FAD)
MTRPHSPALDALLGVAHPVLDHGFVRVVDYMGDDASIARAARVSYARHDAVRSAEDDHRLIRYLLSHRHTSPFEMCEIKMHVKAPIFVARQWMRHRMSSINEVSARYTTLPADVYVPEFADICGPGTDNKQGRGRTLGTGEADRAWGVLCAAADDAVAAVARLTTGEPAGPADGPDAWGLPAVAPEIARMVGPVSQYTEWVWKIDLHNLLHFLSLRMDPHAQLEIRRYAEVIARIVEAWVPTSYEAFRDYRLNATTLSAGQTEAVRRMLRGVPTTAADVGLSAREWVALHARFGGAL